MKLLITGGAGYIGSHTSVQVIEAGHEVIILDNLANSSAIAVERIEEITGIKPVFIKGDIRNASLLDKIFTDHCIEAVIHFAGLKAVGESNDQPLEYYDVNVNGSIQLLLSMAKNGVNRLIFSSSATVYGEESPLPYTETMQRGKSTNPYGSSKIMVERMLEDLSKSDPEWSIVLLRYFNPIGAHPSGRIGEDPKGVPNNLMPYITQVASGRLERLSIFGNNYETPDGTCQRDYLHVMDLADGHLAALKILNDPGCQIYNLGTGNPISVLEMITAFERTNLVPVPYNFAERRNGDLPAVWANTEKASLELDWATQRTIEEMMRDSWNWQKQNPDGYASHSKGDD